jgi:AhpD family alkylhydroperoxidase
MNRRMELDKVTPAGYQAIINLEKYVRSTSLDKRLLELIKIRASQINGCAFCIDMHTKDARKGGETEQRIYALSAWRDTPFFTLQEQSVLALTEAITLISHNHVSDEIYDEVAKHFEAKVVGELILAIITINAWNRIAITTGQMPS